MKKNTELISTHKRYALFGMIPFVFSFFSIPILAEYLPYIAAILIGSLSNILVAYFVQSFLIFSVDISLKKLSIFLITYVFISVIGGVISMALKYYSTLTFFEINIIVVLFSAILCYVASFEFLFLKKSLRRLIGDLA